MKCKAIVEYDLKEPIFFKRSGAEALLASKDIIEMTAKEADIVHGYFDNCDKRLNSAVEKSYWEIWYKFKDFSGLKLPMEKFKVLVDEFIAPQTIFEEFDEENLFVKLFEEVAYND